MITFSIIVAAVFSVDWWTKSLVRARMPIGREIVLLPFFSLTHVQNTGTAFGLFQRWNSLLIIVGLAVSVGVIWAARRLVREDRPSALALALVLGGAFGNMTDRLLRGRVTDFLDFFWGVHHWPAFNVADSAICVGAGLMFVRQLRGSSKG